MEVKVWLGEIRIRFDIIYLYLDIVSGVWGIGYCKLKFYLVEFLGCGEIRWKRV